MEPAERHAGVAELLALLQRHGLTLASVESLTGGMFAAAITSVPGASGNYLGGFVTYASRLKHELVGVDAASIRTHGVVNAATAEAMARGGRQRTGADVAVACTGVAGPDPQDGALPGTVFIAVSTPERVLGEHLALDGDRQVIREATVDAMMGLVRSILG